MNRLPMFGRLWKISRCKNLQNLGITAEVIVVIGQKWIINEVWFLELVYENLQKVLSQSFNDWL